MIGWAQCILVPSLAQCHAADSPPPQRVASFSLQFDLLAPAFATSRPSLFSNKVMSKAVCIQNNRKKLAKYQPIVHDNIRHRT